MRELILKALRESVKNYSDIMPLLKGNARWMGEIYAHKIGEAPDDEIRVKDEQLLQDVLQGFFQGQMRRILSEIRKEFGSKSIYQPSFWDNEKKKFWDSTVGTFIKVVLHGIDGATGLLPEWGKDILDNDKVQDAVIDAVTRYRMDWIEKIGDTTMDLVWKEVRSWEQSGDPLDVLIKTLQEKEEFLFGKERARRIAVTEVTRLNAIGNELAWQETGYIAKWNWMTAMDELVCPICSGDADPTRGMKNGPYPLSELHKMLPAHPNCRCWSQPIVDTELIQQQREQLWEGVNFD